MSTGTLTRPRSAAAQAGGRTSTTSPRWRTSLVGLVAAGVVAGGTWGMLTPREAGHAHGTDGHAALATVDLPDGTLRVDGLVDKQVGHVMAGMSMTEDVPQGLRRMSVNVTLGATEDEPLSYTRRDFTVSGAGVAPVTPVLGQIDSGVLAPGRAISGSLSFDVPEEATALSLRFRDAEPVTLPALPPVTSGKHGDHGQAPADVPAPAAPAQEAPAADHHDAPGSPAHEH